MDQSDAPPPATPRRAIDDNPIGWLFGVLLGFVLAAAAVPVLFWIVLR